MLLMAEARGQVPDIVFTPIHSSFFGDWTGTVAVVRARLARLPCFASRLEDSRRVTTSPALRSIVPFTEDVRHKIADSFFFGA